MCVKLHFFSGILLIGISSWVVSASDEDGNRSIDNNTAPTFESLLDRLRKPEGRLEGKGLTTDIFVANYLAMLKKGSDYPTAFTTANISAQCKQDSLNYYTAHKNFQLWALQMYESSGKHAEGLFGSRTVQAFGLFDECLDVQARPFNDTSKQESGAWVESEFTGQYCSVFFNTDVLFPNETDFVNGTQLRNPSNRLKDFWSNWAHIIQIVVDGPIVTQPRQKNTGFTSPALPRVDLCIPSSCSYEDLRIAVASFVGKRVFASLNDPETNQSYFVAVSTETGDGYCYTKKEIEKTPSFDGPDIAVIVTLSLLGLLALIATLYDGCREYCNQPIDLHVACLPVRVLHCFSVLNNGRKILRTRVNSTDNLGCINGLRVLSTTWVVMGHSYYKAREHSIYDDMVLHQESKQWQFHGVVTMATVAVDTFFVMSGLLVAYFLLRELERNKGRFNIIIFYVHRYLRLTPVYAVILGFIATLMVYTTTGPSWENIVNMKSACRSNWWNNLFYINNYVRSSPLWCMGHCWYSACDMQMFLASPLFIYPLWRNWKAGLSWTIFVIITLQAGLLALFINWNVPATLFASRDTTGDRDALFFGYYAALWTRFPPYLVGILLGWILYFTKGKGYRMHRIVVIGGWLIAAAVALSVTYGLSPYLDPIDVPKIDDLVRISFGSSIRLAWALAIAWVIFACINGYGGFVNRLLSWKAFIPLARLTYVVYLIHFEYHLVYWSHARKPYYYTVLDHMQYYFGVLFMIFLLAFIISVTVEAPFINLEKLLFNPVQHRPIRNIGKSRRNADDWGILRANHAVLVGFCDFSNNRAAPVKEDSFPRPIPDN